LGNQPQRLRIHASAMLYFDAVRRAGTIREAARRLNVASSAVNRQILKLETEIGAQLFERLCVSNHYANGANGCVSDGVDEAPE